jgi:hypothetical protein
MESESEARAPRASDLVSALKRDPVGRPNLAAIQKTNS